MVRGAQPAGGAPALAQGRNSWFFEAFDTTCSAPWSSGGLGRGDAAAPSSHRSATEPVAL